MKIVRQAIYSDVDAERERQDERFGIQYHEWPVWSVVLSEECGEVAEACLMAEWGGPDDVAQLREELIQVAAVALLMVEKIDSSEYPEPAARENVQAV